MAQERVQSVFYSWQSDLASSLNRSFIEEALQESIERLGETALDPAVRGEDGSILLDKDTKGVSGSPDIKRTILDKIESCSAFVADLTPVGRTPGGKALPNPNVMIEYGWALAHRGAERIVSVMNTAYGKPLRDLPFDLKSARGPITYKLKSGQEPERVDAEKAELVAKLVDALRAVLDFDTSQQPATETPPPFSVVEGGTENGSWVENDQPIFTWNRGSLDGTEVYLRTDARIFARLHPLHAASPFPSAAAVAEAMRNAAFRAFLYPYGQESHPTERIQDGAVCTTSLPNEDEVQGHQITVCATKVFTSGEIWGVNAFKIPRWQYLAAEQTKEVGQQVRPYLLESAFREELPDDLESWLSLLRTHHEAEIPVKLSIGIVGARGYGFRSSSPEKYWWEAIRGKLLTDHLIWERAAHPPLPPIADLVDEFIGFLKEQIAFA